MLGSDGGRGRRVTLALAGRGGATRRRCWAWQGVSAGCGGGWCGRTEKPKGGGMGRKADESEREGEEGAGKGVGTKRRNSAGWNQTAREAREGSQAARQAGLQRGDVCQPLSVLIVTSIRLLERGWRDDSANKTQHLSLVSPHQAPGPLLSLFPWKQCSKTNSREEIFAW